MMDVYMTFLFAVIFTMSIRHIADGDYEVLGWHTYLACEFWSFLKMVTAADVCRLQEQGIRIIEVTTPKRGRYAPR